VVSPNLLSLTASTSAAMKMPGNVYEDTDDPEPAHIVHIQM